MKIKALLITALFFFYSMTALAQVVILPECLKTQLTTPFKVLSANNSLSLIEINSLGLQELMDKKNHGNCGGFMNVTHQWQQEKHHLNATDFLRKSMRSHKHRLAAQTFKIEHGDVVNQLLNQFNPQRLWDTLQQFSSFKDRYADSDTGVQAFNWLQNAVEKELQIHHRQDVQFYEVKTDGYRQSSLLVRIGSSSKEPAVVIGAHMDTLKAYFSNKPGADDDGSGSMTVLETAKLLIQSGLTFKKPIYFMWYAAEEEGLVGSQAVVTYFKAEKIPVAGVLHFDMTGFAHKNDLTLWLMDDNTDSSLNDFLNNLINTYVKRPVKYTRCGYACSDHASWDQAGFPATIAAEAKMEYSNPYMHTANDTIEQLSLTHMTDYAKLAIAFAVELAEPN